MSKLPRWIIAMISIFSRLKSLMVVNGNGINSDLSRDRARLVLTMAMDNHDANIGINWEVLTEYIDRVLEMAAAGII